MFFCFQDLVSVTGGQLSAASMPPLAGAWVQIARIVLDAPLVEAGDVFWCVDDQPGQVELAYLRGALAVVSDRRSVHPWPGTFSLFVEDSVAALDRLVTAIQQGGMKLAPERFSAATLDDFEAHVAPMSEGSGGSEAAAEESVRQSSELKVLQLCRGKRVDIYPPTCGRSAEAFADRCRRRAA
jgi:hypothetical protein